MYVNPKLKKFVKMKTKTVKLQMFCFTMMPDYVFLQNLTKWWGALLLELAQLRKGLAALDMVEGYP